MSFNDMLEAMRDSPEPASARQLWVINDLSIKLKKEFVLPLLKYEASLIIAELKTEQSNTNASDEEQIFKGEQ
jgi:hypothetical protein